MRIRKRPAFFLSTSSPHIQSLDPMTEKDELKNNNLCPSNPVDHQSLLHSVEDLQLNQFDQSCLSSFLHSKRDLEESHSQNPSAKASKNSQDNNKRRKPGLLMEGSRCSRVNGRGWRCSQPTLVGYSLCEHHLGKGRLRNISSVKEKFQNSSPEVELMNKEKKKIGFFKARSLSSLLGDDVAGGAALPPPQLRRSDGTEEC